MSSLAARLVAPLAQFVLPAVVTLQEEQVVEAPSVEPKSFVDDFEAAKDHHTG